MDLSEFKSLLNKLLDEANSIPEERFLFFKKINININLIELLEVTIAEKIYYFKSKYKPIEILALGTYKTFNDLSSIKTFMANHPEVFIPAPLNFETNENFFSKVFMGEWTFVKENETLTIILARNNTQMFSKFNLFFDLNIKSHLHYDTISWKEVDESPNHDQWVYQIENAKKIFNENKVKKIVLSRNKSFVLSYPIEPRLVFIKLLKNNHKSDEVYNIFFQENITTAFMSISPEILFSMDNNIFFTISLAGSTPRGRSEVQDKIFEDELQSDQKLKAEHEIVTKEIEARIAPFINSKKVGEIKTMKLSYIQHNCVEIVANLKEGTSAFELLEALHPTPAVGGHPKDEAIKFIFEIENKKRNHYAAPLGYLNHLQVEFSVAIRSGEMKNQTLTVFGGAGILQESRAEDEWIETGMKMSPFLRVFNHD